MEISPLVFGHKVLVFIASLTASGHSSSIDPHLLSAGQLQWMDYELLLPALRPLFLCNGLPPSTVDHLIQDAQHDLYHPPYPPSTLLHIAYASKCL